MSTDRSARIGRRVLLTALAFVPAPLVAAFPGIAPWLSAPVAGLPVSAYLGVAYLLFFMALTASFARATAGAED